MFGTLMRRRSRARHARAMDSLDVGGDRADNADEPACVYGEGDWRNAAFEASMGASQLVAHEALERVKTYAMKVSYDGERYVGFQYQGETKKTIQGELERCLMKLTGNDRDGLKLGASGRTDSGVHARGQIVHFYAKKPLEDLRRAKKAMNGMLPDDIRVDEFWEPHPLFHARFHATRKTYWYYLDTRETADAFSRKYAHQVGWKPPDLDILRQACSMLVGTMDYQSFCNTSRDKAKNETQNTVRTIYRMDVVEEPHSGLVRVEVEGSGFLYRQVRNMIGALLVVATGRYSFDDFQRIIDAKDRKIAPMGAPAKGLFLMRVDYPKRVLTPPVGRDGDGDDGDDDDDDVVVAAPSHEDYSDEE